MKKNWFESKTIWVNFLAFVAIVLQAIYGKEMLNPAAQGMILTVINMVLRFITKHQIDWSKEEEQDV
jgi:hypothetical protein